MTNLLRSIFPTRRTRLLFVVLLLILSLLKAFSVTRGWSPADGSMGFTDTDPWIRLVLVEQLQSSGNWYDHFLPRLGAPEGTENHWTRPLDVMLLVGAEALHPFMDSFKTALFWWAAYYNAFLLVGAAGFLGWGLRALRVTPVGIGAAMLGFVVDPLVGQVFAAGRADNNSLLSTTFLALIACVLYARSERQNSALYIRAMGLVMAFGVWVAPEFLIPSALVMIWYGLDWLRGDARALSRLLPLAFYAAVGVIVALAVERPPFAWLTTEYDRISLLHVALMASAALMAGLLEFMAPARAGLPRKLLAAGALAGCAGVALNYQFPGFYLGPMAAADPELMAFFRLRVAELQSAFDPGYAQFTVALYDRALFIPLLWLAWRRTARAGWCWLAMALTVLFVFTSLQLRWLMYPVMLSFFGLGLLADITWRWLCTRYATLPAIHPLSGTTPAGVRTLARITVCVVAMLFAVPAALIPTPTASSGSRVFLKPSACGSALRAAIQQNDLARFGIRRHATLFLPMDLAPHVLYWTQNRVVASFYHRNSEALHDYYDLAYAPDAETAKNMIEKRGIDTILWCADTWPPPSLSPSQKTTPFFDALAAGKHPEWLEPFTPLPDPQMHVYRVKLPRKYGCHGHLMPGQTTETPRPSAPPASQHSRP